MRLVGQDLIPVPDVAYRKSDPFLLNNGQLGAPRSTGLWSIGAEPRHSGDLDLQIAELLASVSEDPVTWRKNDGSCCRLVVWAVHRGWKPGVVVHFGRVGRTRDITRSRYLRHRLTACGKGAETGR